MRKPWHFCGTGIRTYYGRWIPPGPVKRIFFRETRRCGINTTTIAGRSILPFWKIIFRIAHAGKHPVIGRFLSHPTADIKAIRRSQHDDRRIDEGWYRRVWLFNSLNPQTLPDLERLFRETLSRDLAQYRKYAEENIAAGVKARDDLFPAMPLVMGEGATYCGHMGMRWEEQSDSYWSLIEYNSDLLKKNGYWGCVPRTNSGPEDPSWTEFPERLRHANERFLGD